MGVYPRSESGVRSTTSQPHWVEGLEEPTASRVPTFPAKSVGMYPRECMGGGLF